MHLSQKDRESKIAVIEQWKQSGLTQKAFYQQQNIPAHQFYYWHKCYRDWKEKNNGSAAFVELHTDESRCDVEVQLANGTRVFFHQGVP